MSLLLLRSLSAFSVVLENGNSHYKTFLCKCTQGLHHTFILLMCHHDRLHFQILPADTSGQIQKLATNSVHTCILFLFWYQTRKSHLSFYENCMQRNWAPLAIAKWIFDNKCIISKSTDTSTSRIKVFLCDFMVTLLFLMVCSLKVKRNQCANSIVLDDGIYILSERCTWLLS